MSIRTTLTGVMAAATLVLIPLTPAQAENQSASDEKAWQFHAEHIIGYDVVKDYATLPIRQDVTIIDSRPNRKYSAGHVPTALTMPDLKFDDMAAGLLPEDKSSMLIFYCGGLK